MFTSVHCCLNENLSSLQLRGTDWSNASLGDCTVAGERLFLNVLSTLPCQQEFLSCMAFNIYKVVRVACLSRSLLGEFRELKQRWRRLLRKRHLKSEFALLQTLPRYSISFNSSLNCWQIKFFWSWILKDCIKVQEKKRKVVVSCSLPRQNVKLDTFTW